MTTHPVTGSADTGERESALTRAMWLCTNVAKRCRESGQFEKMYGANQCWNAIYEELHATPTPASDAQER